MLPIFLSLVGRFPKILDPRSSAALVGGPIDLGSQALCVGLNLSTGWAWRAAVPI